MTSSPNGSLAKVRDDLPPALSSMWRLCKLGYRHEPGLLLTAFVLALVAALPDALLALWFKLLGEGVLASDCSLVRWAAVALARALCAVSLGARVVLLDEPTAQLDVRGEAEIFERVLAATRHCTTILISHRFSTVRQADRICVLEHGRVAELGTHEELMALGGRYRTMFDLQAERFSTEDEQGRVYDVLA